MQAAIDAGTAARYGGGDGLDAAQAQALVDRLEPVRIRAGVGAMLLLSTFLLAASAGAQIDPKVAAAERAYRSGDYVAAAEGFAVAAQRQGADRRLFYNLGNSLFRQQRWAEALVAYRRALLAMPRDAELLANIRLVETKLELATGEGEPFVETLTNLRDRYTVSERLWIAVIVNLLAAGCVIFGRRGLRWVGVALAVPAVVMAAEVVWFGPSRPAEAIVLPRRVDVFAEPRDGLEPVLKLRSGVSVELIGESDAWASVRVEGRQGYLRRESVGVVR